jgi:predicted phosphohydrolase
MSLKCLLTSDTHYGFSNKTHRRHEKFLKEVSEKIKSDDIGLVIHAGDWSCNKQDQFERTLKMFRKSLPSGTKIAAVRGNHEFWDKGRSSISILDSLHRQWFKENDITYLGDEKLIIDDVCIVGFDGWYGSANPATNDAANMAKMHESCPSMLYLSNRAYKELDELLAYDYSFYRKVICVSHFAPFTDNELYSDMCANFNFLKPMRDKFDALCFGHSHQYVKRVEEGTWIYNAGSDYDCPRYLIFEI